MELYPIALEALDNATVTLELPVEAIIVGLVNDQERLTLVVQGPPLNQGLHVLRHFRVFSGWPGVPTPVLSRYVGSVGLQSKVFHVLEETEPSKD